MKRVIAVLAALAIISGAACQSPQEQLEEALSNIQHQRTITQGIAEDTLAPAEIQQLVYWYLAINVWAQNTNTIAQDLPEQFHKIMFSQPDKECVLIFREDRIREPEIPYEPLLECALSKILENDAQAWEEISGEERAARARKAIQHLTDSVDPAAFMTVNIAFSRGLDVNSENNSDFAAFDAQYDRCHLQAEDLTQTLLDNEEPEAMAKSWTNITSSISLCFTLVTNEIFTPDR